MSRTGTWQRTPPVLQTKQRCRLEVEMERLRQLVVALVGREEVGSANGSGVGTVDDKVGNGDERDVRESSHQNGRRLREGKVTGRDETGRRKTIWKESGRKEMRGKATGAKAPGALDHQETGGRGDILTDEGEMDNMLAGDTTAEQNATEGIPRKS